jgi:multidrug resistance efflux pump
LAYEFERSLRALEADRGTGALIGIGCAFVLLLAWALWFFEARVTEYAATDRARIEVEHAAWPVESPVAGRVGARRITLGAEVAAGDVLVELDSAPERHRLEEEQARLMGVGWELAALARMRAAEEQTIANDRKAQRTARSESRARRAEVDLGAEFARLEAGRVALLAESGVMAQAEVLRSQTEARKLRAVSDAAAFGLHRQRDEQLVRENRAQGELERLRREEASLEARREASRAAIETLSYEIERRKIRAPIAGRVADDAAVPVGAYVEEGVRLAVIVPAGELKIVAQVPTEVALGRVHPGQKARMRLDGYPWTEFGTVPAVVSGVASEPRDGTVRVELDLEPSAVSPRIVLEHGFEGTLEVDVIELSPASLVRRIAGRWLLAEPSKDGS